MKQLYDLEPAEISLVARGANKRKFLVFKNEDGVTLMDKQELLKRISEVSPETLAAVDKVLKSMPTMSPEKVNWTVNKESGETAGGEAGVQNGGALSAQAQTALKAVARILSPFPEITPEVLGKVLHAAAGTTGAAPAATVGKLGSPMYPTPSDTTLKSGLPMDGDVDDEDEEGETVEKSTVVKSDGTLDLSAVPDAVRPAVEAIYKQQLEAVKKAETLEAQLTVERENRVKREFEVVAKSFKHLGVPSEELAVVLKGISEKHSSEEYAKIEKMLRDADTKIANSNLLAEIGTSREFGGSSWEAIEKAAVSVVAKSGESLSKEEATARFLETPEGKRMYADYKGTKKGGA